MPHLQDWSALESELSVSLGASVRFDDGHRAVPASFSSEKGAE